MIILVEDYIQRDPGFLYEIISDSLEKGIKLVINFKGVDTLSSEYLNESIGRIIKENNFEEIKNRLNFINVEKEIKKQITILVNSLM